jgi:UDP-N-acetylmuramoylalanine--D-glutamate ligase
VYGLARSGLATVEALLASGAKVTAWDAKEEARSSLRAQLAGRETSEAGGGVTDSAPLPLHHPADGSPPHALHGEELTIADLDAADLTQFDSLVVTPGLPLNRHPIAKRARDAGVEIIGDIELFARARGELPPHKVVGITGTNGKSTTTALVHHILKTAGVPTAMGGNIGLPILAQDALTEGGVYVLELSSYQIDLTQSLDCDVAVLLNITPDHLDRYESFEAYAASKARLFEMQSAGQITAISITDPSSAAIEARYGALGFKLGGTKPAKQAEWPALQGPHNADNAAAAWVAAVSLGVPYATIEESLRTYPGLPHRMERIRD